MKSRHSFSTILATICAACFLFCSCGGSGDGTPIQGSVSLTASAITAADAGASVSKLVTERSTPTGYYVMVYKVEISKDIECPTSDSGWTTIYSNTATTECSTSITLEQAQASADYKNINSNPDYGTQSGIATGTYSCMRITMCDQIVAVGATASCPGPYYTLDVYNRQSGGTSDVAETVKFYWSTNGSDPNTDPYITGSSDDPFLLTAFEVTSGETTSLDMQFNIIESLVYDVEDDYPCHVNSPIVGFVQK